MKWIEHRRLEGRSERAPWGVARHRSRDTVAALGVCAMLTLLAAAPGQGAPRARRWANALPSARADADAAPAQAAASDAASSGTAGTPATGPGPTTAGTPDTAVPTAAPAPSDPGRRLVAVLDLRHGAEDDALANALAAVLTAEVATREGLRAVSRNELMAVLSHKAEQALLGCDSVKCAADIAALVEADFVVAGGIERAGNAFVFTLTLIDPTVPEVKQRVEAVWRSAPEEMTLLARPFVDRLFEGPAATAYAGAVEVLAPAGAALRIDGQPLGQAPLAHAVPALPIGVHRVEVVQPGYQSAERDVVVQRGETTIVRIELEPEPLWRQWWFWAAAGGTAAVATAAGTMFGLWYLQETSEARVVVK